jgi:hypothetical protein
MICFSLGLICNLLAATALAQTQRPNVENYDQQSPQEIERARAAIQHDFAHAIDPLLLSPSVRTRILKSYGYLDPKHEVPSDLLADAVLYYDTNKASFNNLAYITVVNFKSRSDNYRFFLINMKDGSVEKFHTTHGSGSDPEDDGYAKTFSNVPDSRKSSLGFIRTAEVYFGHYNRSIRLDGISATNSNIRARAIVFHGSDKVHEANVIEGRSWGCIAMDWAVKDRILDKIKEGSLMYIGVSKLP